jgi:hypothetical protein
MPLLRRLLRFVLLAHEFSRVVVDVDCIICGHRRSGSVEHITGAWLEREMVRRDKLEELPNITTPVCGRCNRRMNRRIEQPVQKFLLPLVFDEGAHQLTRAQQRDLARWALKVMILMSMSRFAADVPQPLLDWLAAPGHPWPPSMVMMWTGRGIDGTPSLTDEQLQSLEPPLPWRIVEWGGGFSVMHFAVFAACSPAFAQWRPTHPAEAAEYVVSLPHAPPRGHLVTWPPPRPLHNPTFAAVTRFAK